MSRSVGYWISGRNHHRIISYCDKHINARYYGIKMPRYDLSTPQKFHKPTPIMAVDNAESLISTGIRFSPVQPSFMYRPDGWIQFSLASSSFCTNNFPLCLLCFILIQICFTLVSPYIFHLDA